MPFEQPLFISLLEWVLSADYIGAPEDTSGVPQDVVELLFPQPPLGDIDADAHGPPVPRRDRLYRYFFAKPLRLAISIDASILLKIGSLTGADGFVPFPVQQLHIVGMSGVVPGAAERLTFRHVERQY